jgi:hypothetical protein
MASEYCNIVGPAISSPFLLLESGNSVLNTGTSVPILENLDIVTLNNIDLQ